MGLKEILKEQEPLTDFVKERIETIHRTRKIPIEDIKASFEHHLETVSKFYSGEIEKRQNYAMMCVWNQYVSRAPVRSFKVIPIGFSGIRITRKGLPQSSLYAYVRYKKETKFRRIVLRGETAEKIKEITPFARYSVNLGWFRKPEDGDLIADDRAWFDDPEPLMKKNGELMSPREFLERMEKRGDVRRITCLDAGDNLSEKVTVKGKKYTNTLDWRVIKGWIAKTYQGERKDGSKFGVYTITDESLTENPVVSEEGTIDWGGFTVWIAPELMEYDVNDLCEFYGTIEKGKESVNMNCYAVIPIQTMRRGDEDEVCYAEVHELPNLFQAFLRGTDKVASSI